MNATCLNTRTPSEVSSAQQTPFDPGALLTRLGRACSELRRNAEEPWKLGELWLERQLPTLLAKELVSDDGVLHSSLAGLIQAQASGFAGIDLSQPRFRELLLGLERLAENQTLVASIEGFEGPLHPRGEIIVRATLQIPLNQAVTQVDARRCLVSALLSHLRQGPAGSCFATAWCVSLLADKAEQCVTDWIDLLQHGELVRRPFGEKLSFPCTLSIAADGLDKRIQFQANDEKPLCRRPVMRPLEQLSGLGSKQWAELLDQVVEDFAQELPGVWPLARSVEHFAHRIAARLSDDSSEQQSIAATLRLCYQSYFAHPLLRCWESTVASMAEAESSSPRSQELRDGLERLWENYPEPSFAKAAQNAVLARSRHLYTPDFSFDSHADNWHRHRSAFVLYDTHNERAFDRWTVVENPADFHDFVSRALLDAGIPSDNAQDLVAPLLTDEGVQTVIADREENPTLDKPFEHYRALRYTPWVSFSGNNDYRVRQIHQNQATRPGCQWFYAQSPSELLWGLCRRVQRASTALLGELSRNPHFLLPVSTVRHSFNLPIGHQKWQKLISDCHSESALNELLGSAVADIASKVPDDWQRGQIRNQLLTRVPAEQSEKANAIFTKDLPYRELRERVLTDFEPEAISATQLDQWIWDSLGDADRQRLSAAAIPIADLNYRSDQGHDQLLAIMYNPISEKSDLWCYENGKVTQLANREKYLSGKTWELNYSVTSSLYS